MSDIPEENTYEKLELVNSDIDESIKFILKITQKGFDEEEKRISKRKHQRKRQLLPADTEGRMIK
tara:strand:- start:176 stop:370 length:195 start_codon:yes stop_codon:yes gene_type:complete